MTLSIALIIAIVLFVVGCIFAVYNQEKTPLFFIVTAGVFLYVFGGVL